MAYRIQRVARLTGIPAATLRAWERRYRLVQPDRTTRGYRLYSERDVQLLERLKALVDGGLRIGEAVEQVRRDAPAALPAHADAEGSLDCVRAELMLAVLAMDRAAALRACDRLAHVSPVRQVDEVLFPVMRRIGELWETEEACVAQEHFASAFVAEQLALLLRDAPSTPTAREAVCAGIPGDRHGLGLLGAAVHLAARGWRVTQLGPDLPLEEIADVLRARRPALFCTSVALPMKPCEFEALARRLREAAPQGTRVVVGGCGIPEQAREDEPEGVRLADDFGDLFLAD